jgi:hypothetical protein
MTPKVNIPMNYIRIKAKAVKPPDDPNEVPACPMCGATKNLLVNGYCIDCDEELTAQIK